MSEVTIGVAFRDELYEKAFALAQLRREMRARVDELEPAAFVTWTRRKLAALDTQIPLA